MKVKKAVITAAGRGMRLYPMADTVQKAMLPIIDIDGLQKNIIQVIAEEALAGGIEEIAIVCAPGDDKKYLESFRILHENLKNTYKGVDWAEKEALNIENLLDRLQFCVQDEPKGYGDAVLRAEKFAAGDPFLLLLGDYLYVSSSSIRCTRQLLDIAEKEKCSVSAVNSTFEHLISNYGTLKGKHIPNISGLYEIEKIIEKPSISLAEMELQTPGLRNGHYLCFFGMHVFTPYVFNLINQVNTGKGLLLLTPALQELAKTEKYLAAEIKGNRYDIGKKYGLFQAQLALALSGPDKNHIMSHIVELFAEAYKRI